MPNLKLLLSGSNNRARTRSNNQQRHPAGTRTSQEQRDGGTGPRGTSRQVDQPVNLLKPGGRRPLGNGGNSLPVTGAALPNRTRGMRL